ncbi:DNRLRE domain-containing protein [Haloimpatiens sp. FM7330]|uniref:DNRLRE domain-containing protein n=1 Tax=Haloimpatiens sp. FM7330 TaxID=3298610 RepID=UPI0036322D2B
MPNIILPVSEDTSISQMFPDDNFGGDSSLCCGRFSSLTSIYRILLKFDLSSIPSTTAIESAVLKLYINQNSVPGIPKPTKVYNLLSSFSEYDVTYSTQPTFDPTEVASSNITSEMNTYIEWDITSLVRNWHLGITTNYGLLIRGLESEYSLTGFVSREHPDTDIHPILEISCHSDTDLIEYPPEDVTSTGNLAYSSSILLGGGIATFCMKNLGPKPVYIFLQLSADNINWIDDHPTFIGSYQLDQGNTLTIKTSGYMPYARLVCLAYDCSNPSDQATLRVYKTVKY